MTSQENYTQCVRSELELFSTPPLQVAVEEGQWIEYNPVSSISSSAPIEFTVTGSGDEYIDLNKTLLEVKAVIKQADGQQTSKTSHIAPINNTLQSLFSQVDVSLNDVPVSSSTTTYPYRAYIENHLNYGSDAKDSRLSAGLYFMDEVRAVWWPIFWFNNLGLPLPLVRSVPPVSSIFLINLSSPLADQVFFGNSCILSSCHAFI